MTSSGLEGWYARHCFQEEDDPWEEQYGVTIETLDNPGWSLKVDLVGTELEEKPLSYSKLEEKPLSYSKNERSEHDWVHLFVRGGKFNGVGGPRNLVEILKAFRHWALSSELNPSQK